MEHGSNAPIAGTEFDGFAFYQGNCGDRGQNITVSLVERVKGRWSRFVDGLPGAKERGELSYWKQKLAEEGVLRNDHYKFLYTEHWGFDDQYFEGKSVLDIGCGPRGSLEWADMTSERVGLDSLIKEYRQLGIDQHKMSYIDCPIEKTPYSDGHFDVVTSVNSLDHVDDLDAAIAEIKRITRRGGVFLLLVEVNHPPTVCEPHTLKWDIVEKFAPEFVQTRIQGYEMKGHSMRETITGEHYNKDNGDGRPGMLSALLTRH